MNRPTRFQIDHRWVGPDEPTYFIADIAANHDGDIKRAKRLIELAKEAGADAAKFQNFQAPKIVSRHGFEKMGSKLSHQSKWKKSVYEVYEDAEVKKEWTAEIKKHCDDVGITYFTTPYDKESVDLVDPYVPAYKIGSGDITFLEILEYIAKKNKPLLLATGASNMIEVSQAMEVLERAAKPTTPICIMQCNTNYTGSIENFRFIHLNVLKSYQVNFPNALLGLSDHTPGHATVLGAVVLGARMIEKHFTDDNHREGPDHAFSLNPITWRDMVDRTRELEYALGDTIKKVEENEQQSVLVQRRGMYSSKVVRKGDKITAETIEALRPAPLHCFTPAQGAALIGRIAERDYEAGECFLSTDWK